MNTHIGVCLWCCLTSLIPLLLSALDESADNYIIHMDLSVMPKAFSSQHSWYVATLSSALDNSRQVTTNFNSLPSNKLIYSYTNVMNGFSASLTPAELEALKISPGYISSIWDLPAKRDTTHSPQFLSLNPNAGSWPAAEYGKDVIIGLIDTGIWPESESFKDDGMSEIPPRWKGQCESGTQFNSSLCNKKLIGARFFNRGLLAKNRNVTIVMNSTRDTDGHGTHTSSTAAGSKVDGASYFGYASGSATGIAPRARVAMYKALWEEGAHASDIIAAIDSAIADGVDVLSLSLGFDDVPLFQDPIAIATFAALHKGIFVSTSAGNEGPFHATLHNGTPWVITVAAGTLDREFHGNLTLSNGVAITGSSLYPGDSPIDRVPLVFMGLCDNVKELAKVKSKIVVCEDKNETIGEQMNHLDTAKVVGGIFISKFAYSDITFFFQTNFPSIFLNPMKGEIVKDYIKANSKPKASMVFKVTILGTRPAPSVDSYSSRGPSQSCPFVLKPDVLAPGTLILAAWPSNVAVARLESQKLFSKFNLISGTSMACPHVAGVAALLKGAHPDWSPAAIRSAIMTTSDMLDNTPGPVKDIGHDNKPASPLALGAGHVNPNRALDPGLVYDAQIQDYVNLLCALNYTQKNITIITGSSFNNCSNPSLDLNYPSFIAFFNANVSTTVKEFRRTVTNVGEGQTRYIASITPIEGFKVSVTPQRLVFKEKNEKLSYKVRIEGRRAMKKTVAFGYLTWTDLKHQVRSPIVVTSLSSKQISAQS